jgi:hypothetical protein
MYMLLHFARSPLPYAQFVEDSITLSIAVADRVDLGFGASRFSSFQTLNGGESTLILDGCAFFRIDLAAKHKQVVHSASKATCAFGNLSRTQVRKHRSSGCVVGPFAPSHRFVFTGGLFSFSYGQFSILLLRFLGLQYFLNTIPFSQPQKRHSE